MANDAKQGGVERGGQNRVIIAAGAFLIVALVGVIVALVILMNRNQPESESEPERELRSVVVNEDNAEELLDQIMSEESEPVGTGFYEVKMTTTWNFPDGASAAENAYVENVPTNTNDVYFNVELRDTGEVLYESPVIPLGSHLRDITLERDLDAGSYPCVLTYYMVDEEQRVVDSLRMGLQVVVEN